jgi:hypothetical protein
MKNVKNILITASFIVVFAGCKSNTTPPPTTPSGSGIGPDGGTVTSADGKVKLVIPPSALSSTQTVAIVASTDSNTCPQKVGTLYSLTPNGLQFSKPAILTLPYSDSSLVGSNPKALGVAYKDDAGAWWGVTGGSVDTVAKTATVPISHFSDWTEYASYELTASRPIALTPGTEDIVVAVDGVGPPLSQAPGDPQQLGAGSGTVNTWFVNYIAGGNAQVGTINNTLGPGLIANYNAPAQMPSPNIVTLTADLELPDQSHFTVSLDVALLAKNWLLHWYYNYGFVCGPPSSLFSYDYNGGGTTNRLCDPNGNLSIQGSFSPFGTGVNNADVCADGSGAYSSVNVQLGTAGSVTGATGYYNQTTNAFIVTVNGRNFDIPGLTLVSKAGAAFNQVKPVTTSGNFTNPIHFPSLAPGAEYDYPGDTVSDGQYDNFRWNLTPQ